MRLTWMWSIFTGPLKSWPSPSSPSYSMWGQIALCCASTGPDPRARSVSSVTPVWLLSCATLPAEPVVAWSCLCYCALVKSSRLCEHTCGLERQTAARWSLISTLSTEIRYPSVLCVLWKAVLALLVGICDPAEERSLVNTTNQCI